MKNILYKIFEIPIIVFGFYLAKIPHCLFYSHIKSLAWLLRKCDKRRYKDALANLDFAFENTLSTKEKQQIIKRCYRNFVFVILESIRLPYLNPHTYYQRFCIQNKDLLFDILKKDTSLIMLSAHYGYWEALGTIFPMEINKDFGNFRDYGIYSLGRLTGIDFIDQMIIKRREIFNVGLINKTGAFKKLLKLYASKPTAVGILVDQNISQSEGIEIDFFSKRATHTTIASILSRRFDIPIVPVLIDFNENYSSFSVQISEPFKTPNTQDMQRDIQESTQKQALILENAIRKNPSSWFWFHKRWKTFYPEIYAKKSND